jgi:hypothetical protein
MDNIVKQKSKSNKGKEHIIYSSTICKVGLEDENDEMLSISNLD